MRVVGIALAIAIGATVPGVYVGLDAQPVGSTSAAAVLQDPLVDEFVWSSADDFRDVAFEVRVRVAQEAECRLLLSASGRTTDGGAEFVKVVRTDEGHAWSSLAQDGTVAAHVEGVADTRGVSTQVQADRWAMKSEHRRPGMVGNFSWFFAAQELAPWPEQGWNGEDSLRMRFTCDAPFRVEAILAANDVLLANEASLSEGQTVRVVAVGTLVRGERLAVDLRSPTARLMVGQDGNEGVLGLTLPEGERALDLASSDEFFSFSQGPGAYGLELDCLCHGMVWAVWADLRPASELSHVLRATG